MKTMPAVEASEKPILFSGPMVRAILEGRKTQTRRVMRPQPFLERKEDGNWWLLDRSEDGYGRTNSAWQEGSDPFWTYCPYGKPGDRLWVRETFARCACDTCRAIWPNKTPHGILGYQATYGGPSMMRFRPSIHMPRWASRLTLEIVSVKVERLQDISEADAIAEGCTFVPFEQWYSGRKPMVDGSLSRQECRGIPPDTWTGIEKLNAYDPLAHTAVQDFRRLWDSINSKRGFGWAENPWVWCIEFKKAELPHAL